MIGPYFKLFEFFSRFGVSSKEHIGSLDDCYENSSKQDIIWPGP